MRELLQQIDLDYYRIARLIMAHAELEHLRQERPVDVAWRAAPNASIPALGEP
jgi:hypothetical protein